MVQASWVALLGHNVIATGINIYDDPDLQEMMNTSTKNGLKFFPCLLILSHR
jgi:hypothetical protein